MFDLVKEAPSWVVAMSTILAFVPLIKLSHHILDSNRFYKVQNLEAFAKAMESSSERSSRLVVEQLFINQFKVRMDYETIVLLLSLSSPTKAINLYRNSNKYLSIYNGKLVYSPKYKCPKRRRLEKIVKPLRNNLSYWIFAMLGGLSGLYVYRQFDLNTVFEPNLLFFNGAVWLFLLVVSIVSILFAIKCITDTTTIKDAEKLMVMSEKLINTNKWYY